MAGTSPASCFTNFRYNIRNYTLNFALFLTCYGMIWSGLALVISSIEKRYSLSSLQSGFIFSAPEIGRLPMLFVVSHFGNRFRIPCILAIAGIGTSIGQTIMYLPHFIFEGDVVKAAAQGDQFCAATSNGSLVLTTESVVEEQSHNHQAYAMIITGMVLMGFFASPLSNLGFAYIDNNAKEGDAPIFYSISQCAWGIGPIISAFLGSYYISLYVELNTETDLTPKDPAWVGAWWLMILTVSIAVFVTAPFFVIYPKTMKVDHELLHTPKVSVIADEKAEVGKPRESIVVAGAVDLDSHSAYTIKKLPIALARIIRSPVFMLLCMSSIFRDLGNFGFRSYINKYIETQFRTTASTASIYSGMGNVFSIASFLVSGLAMKKLKLSYEGTVKMVLIVGVVQLVLHVGVMFVGCETSDIVGQTPSETMSLAIPPCSAHCACSLEKYTPICDVTNSLTYFSPCHAGCPSDTTHFNDTTLVGNCTCGVGSEFTSSTCDQCDNTQFIIYIVLIYAEFFVFTYPYVPIMGLFMRCVRSEDKGLAMGTSVVFMALLAWMTCAPLYGRVIDMSCSLWQMVDDVPGACWLYDLTSLRLSVHGLTAGLLACCVVVNCVTWAFVRRGKVTWTSSQEDKIRRDSVRSMRLSESKS